MLLQFHTSWGLLFFSWNALQFQVDYLHHTKGGGKNCINPTCLRRFRTLFVFAREWKKASLQSEQIKGQENEKRNVVYGCWIALDGIAPQAAWFFFFFILHAFEELKHNTNWYFRKKKKKLGRRIQELRTSQFASIIFVACFVFRIDFIFLAFLKLLIICRVYTSLNVWQAVF